jgi:hypothetical protein
VSFDPGTGKVLQEVYRDDPWRMLVGCILLNLTTRAQVDKVRQELFETWPLPSMMASADTADLEELLRPLGLFKRRAVTLKRFSADYREYQKVKFKEMSDEIFEAMEKGEKAPDYVSPGGGSISVVQLPPPPLWKVREMYGIGKYASDSYRIFILGEKVEPHEVEDKVLRRYLQLQQDLTS